MTTSFVKVRKTSRISQLFTNNQQTPMSQNRCRRRRRWSTFTKLSLDFAINSIILLWDLKQTHADDEWIQLLLRDFFQTILKYETSLGESNLLAVSTINQRSDEYKTICLFWFIKNLISLTVLENHRKSLIQHCERSELRLQFIKMPKTVLPDRYILTEQKLAENGKINKKIDSFSNFQTLSGSLEFPKFS